MLDYKQCHFRTGLITAYFKPKDWFLPLQGVKSVIIRSWEIILHLLWEIMGRLYITKKNRI